MKQVQICHDVRIVIFIIGDEFGSLVIHTVRNRFSTTHTCSFCHTCIVEFSLSVIITAKVYVG